jgi:outer membrane immunogenic protein
MRRVICAAFVALVLPQAAFAGDYDVLRGSWQPVGPAPVTQPVGPAPFTRWAGFYAGGQVGYTSSSVTFSNAANSDLAFILRDTTIENDQHISEWPVLGSRNPASMSYGAFIGYNVQFQDVILGTEFNYNRLNLAATSSDVLTRSFTDSTSLPAGHHYLYTVTASALASMHLTDTGTFRARAGWVLDNLLPYAFVGFAMGRTDISNSGTVAFTAVDVPDVQTPPTPQLTPLNPLAFGPVTQGNQQSGQFVYGFSTGFGMDVAVTQNIFLRGEFEYIYFAPVQGTQISMESARIGGGVKF